MGAAYADYDNDGQIDFVVGQWDKGYRLHRNTGMSGVGNNWLTVRLEGGDGVNRDAVGSRVYLRLDDGRTLMQEVKIGSSIGAGNDTALYFGLGGAEIVEMVVVWPDGRMVPHEEVEVNQMLTIVR